MYRLTSQLIIYRNIGQDSILFRLADICRRLEQGDTPRDRLAEETLTEVHRLLDLATQYGFNDNLWHNYLAFLLADTETPFTLVSEKVGANTGSVNTFARHDFILFKKLFDYDFSQLEKALSVPVFSVLEDFRSVEKRPSFYNQNVSEKVRQLSKDIEKASTEDELYEVITGFYGRVGVGKFGLNKAFRISEDPERELLIPITNTGDVHLDDLVGYESQKKRLIANTEAFVAGRECNNVLLYGEAGTGKSTSIKAVLNQYYDQGLRMIEIYKHQFQYLSKVISEIKHRNYRFVIFMDDLSFEETELEYKYLKAVIEGGLEPKPENVVIYATSNRRRVLRRHAPQRHRGGEDVPGQPLRRLHRLLQARSRGVPPHRGHPGGTVPPDPAPGRGAAPAGRGLVHAPRRTDGAHRPAVRHVSGGHQRDLTRQSVTNINDRSFGMTGSRNCGRFLWNTLLIFCQVPSNPFSLFLCNLS